jgi:hypothetical protein
MSKREARETKDMGVKRLIESYEKQNRTSCSSEKKREFEKMYVEKVLPRVYDGK